jgi:hypothetical protein
MDKADSYFTDERGEAMWGKIISAIQWSWSQMTLLSVLIVIMLIAISFLLWINLSDRKKLASRAFWRGYHRREKWDNEYAHPNERQ